MASNTPNLGLLKKDPATDGNETFNIKTMLNDNWDKIDEAVGNIEVPEASTTQKGIVLLSNATDGAREDVAATERAVKAAYDKGSEGVSAAGSAIIKANEVGLELVAHVADGVAHGIGNKSALLTTEKSTIVGAVNEVFQSGINVKSSIVAAINATGGAATGNDDWATLANKVRGLGLRFVSGSFSDTAPGLKTISNLPFKPKMIIVYTSITGEWIQMPNNYRISPFVIGMAMTVDASLNLGGGSVSLFWNSIGSGTSPSNIMLSIKNATFGSNSITANFVSSNTAADVHVSSYNVFG